MKKQLGFTAIEMIIAIVILVIAGTVFWLQKQDLEAQHRDATRKTALNAMYYNLEEIVYPSLKGYPAKLDVKALKAMDSELAKDTNGIVINESNSQYRYEPSDCEGGLCKHFVLRATLEKEATYEKTSKN